MTDDRRCGTCRNLILVEDGRAVCSAPVPFWALEAYSLAIARNPPSRTSLGPGDGDQCDAWRAEREEP